MRVVLASRFPLLDVLPWKRELAGELLGRDAQLLIVHSGSGLVAQLRYARQALHEGRGPSAASSLGARERTPWRALRALTRAPRTSLYGWARANAIPTVRTPTLGDARCLEAVGRFSADAMVLLGADIVPAALLARVNGPTLNPHFGLLPEYRGMNATEWAILNDDPVGVSVHTVDTGIDTGAIVARERIDVRPGDDLAALRERQRRIGSRMLLEALAALREGRLEAVAQDPVEGRQYYRMHPRLRAEVVEKLRHGGYRPAPAHEDDSPPADAPAALARSA